MLPAKQSRRHEPAWALSRGYNLSVLFPGYFAGEADAGRIPVKCFRHKKSQAFESWLKRICLLWPVENLFRFSRSSGSFRQEGPGVFLCGFLCRRIALWADSDTDTLWIYLGLQGSILHIPRPVNGAVQRPPASERKMAAYSIPRPRVSRQSPQSPRSFFTYSSSAWSICPSMAATVYSSEIYSVKNV